MLQQKKVLVIGCGGLGGVVSAHLAELGVPVVAVSRNPAVCAAVSARGFQLRGLEGQRSIPGQVMPEIPDGRFDYVLLATQPTDVEQAAQAARPHLAPGGRMVCLQNGLCEERVAAILGESTAVVGAIVSWGATMVEPGLYDRTSAGGFTLGRLDGAADPSLEPLAAMLESIGPVQRTDNLVGARWSKLALNCAISAAGALSGRHLGWLVRQRHVRRLALEVMSEVVAVARRLEIGLEKIAGTLDLDWMALTDEERRQQIGSVSLASKHAMIMAVGLRYRRLRSSMLIAIERGRRPPIDYLNGEVVRRARQLEIPVPYNEAICEQIERIAAGELQPSPTLVRDMGTGSTQTTC